MIKRFAVIYIGSNKCELVVGQRGKGRVNILDRAMYPIDLGSQTFAKGTIDYPSVVALSKILNDYIEIASSSAVDAIEIVGTAALREAVNRTYALEQIRIFTGGRPVRLLTKEEEVSLVCRYMVFTGGADQFNDDRNHLLSIFSSGNISLALIAGGKIVATHNADMGYMKMQELFRDVEERTGNYEALLGDYIAIRSRAITDSVGGRQVGSLTVAAHDVEVIAGLSGKTLGEDGLYRVGRKDFVALQDQVEGLGTAQIMKKYPRITHYQAETLRHTLMLYIKLMKETGMESMTLIPMSIADALMQFQFNVTRDRELREWIADSTYASVRVLAKKFQTDTAHTDAVEEVASRFLGALRVRYQMDARDAQYLRLAAQLLDVGQFVGESNQGDVARDIIENSDIIGLGRSEKRIVGSIVKGVRQMDFESSDPFLRAEEWLRVSKLVAILKLAQALDKSHKQKVSKLRCHLDEQEFVVTVTTSKNIQLEKYFFNLSRQAFRRVFGAGATLRIKRVSL